MVVDQFSAFQVEELDADEIRENARRQAEWEEKQLVDELMEMSRLLKQTIPSILVELLPENVLHARYQDNHMVSWRLEKIPGGWKVEQHRVTTSLVVDPVEEIKHIKVYDR